MSQVLSDEEIDKAQDEASVAFRRNRGRICGQQIQPSDSPDWWFARAIEAAILAKLADRLMQWRRIETAPKDGTVIVATGCNFEDESNERHYVITSWEDGSWIECSEWNDASYLTYLTNWMPLPPAPAIDAQKGKT